MELVLFTGIQAAGKSTFFRERFFDTHVRVNLDMLRTRHRERVLFEACLSAKQPLVVDNTNLTREARAGYIEPARRAGFGVVCYYFRSVVAESLERFVADVDGSRPIRKMVEGHVDNAWDIGMILAGQVLEAGGKEILDEVYARESK